MNTEIYEILPTYTPFKKITNAIPYQMFSYFQWKHLQVVAVFNFCLAIFSLFVIKSLDLHLIFECVYFNKAYDNYFYYI